MKKLVLEDTKRFLGKDLRKVLSQIANERSYADTDEEVFYPQEKKPYYPKKYKR